MPWCPSCDDRRMSRREKRRPPGWRACCTTSSDPPGWGAAGRGMIRGPERTRPRRSRAGAPLPSSAGSGTRVGPDQQDATILLATFITRVVRHRLGLTLADGLETRRIDAARGQVVEHGLRATIRQREVVGIGADAVRMTLDQRGREPDVVHELDQPLELRDRFGPQLCAVEIEQHLERLREGAADAIDARACGCPGALVVGVAHAVVVAIGALLGRWRRRRWRRGLLRDRLRQWLLRAEAVTDRDAVDPRVDVGLAERNCRKAETGRNSALDVSVEIDVAHIHVEEPAFAGTDVDARPAGKAPRLVDFEL